MECGRPRVVYSQSPQPARLVEDLITELLDDDAAEFRCGEPLTLPGGDAFYVRDAVTCGDTIESQYHSTSNKFPPACVHCGERNSQSLVDLVPFRKRYKLCRPICRICYNSGKELEHGKELPRLAGEHRPLGFPAAGESDPPGPAAAESAPPRPRPAASESAPAESAPRGGARKLSRHGLEMQKGKLLGVPMNSCQGNGSEGVAVEEQCAKRKRARARAAPGSGRLGVRKKARLAVSSSSSSDDSSSIDTEEEEDAKPEPATKHEKDGNHSWVRNNKKAYKVWSGDRNTLCEHCERPRKNLTHTRLRTATGGVSCFRCNIVFCFECVTVPARG